MIQNLEIENPNGLDNLACKSFPSRKDYKIKGDVKDDTDNIVFNTNLELSKGELIYLLILQVIICFLSKT